MTVPTADLAEGAAVLRRLLAAVEAGELEVANAHDVAIVRRLQGAVAAFEAGASDGGAADVGQAQGASGLGIAAQRAAIKAECQHRGWDLIEVIVDDGESGKSLDRPGLRRALEGIAAGDASVLVASKLDRLSRSVGDFAALLEWFTSAGAALVAMDVGVDSSTPGGRLVANVFASVAEWERETIGARTRDAVVALRASGRPAGRPAVADQPGLAGRIRLMRERDATYQAIADALNADGVPTPRGGAQWRVSSVQSASGYRRPPARRRPTQLPPVRRPRRQVG